MKLWYQIDIGRFKSNSNKYGHSVGGADIEHIVWVVGVRGSLMHTWSVVGELSMQVWTFLSLLFVLR